MADAEVAQELQSKMNTILQATRERRFALPDFRRVEKKSRRDSSNVYIYRGSEGMAQEAPIDTSLALLKRELKAALSAELEEHRRQQTKVLERLLEPQDACTESRSLSLREKIMTGSLISHFKQMFRHENR